jgi:glycosyltransferase involved in cell wall biosynthesis
VAQKHIVAIPSWYRSARGSGGGYFRDQALALQAAGYRVAMLAPDIYTLRDLRHGRVPPQFGREVRVEDDGIPTWRRETLVLAPRLPYRNAAMLALCGLQLFARYRAQNGMPDLVQAHSMLNAGVVALAIKRRHGIPYIVMEQNTHFALGRLRWWERDLVRRVIAGARQLIAVSPGLAELLQGQYPGSSWDYLPNPLGAAFVADREAFVTDGLAPAPWDAAQPFVFLSAARMTPEKGHALLIEAFAEAFGGDPGSRLILAGDGPMQPRLMALCRERGVAAQVDFPGLLSASQVRDAMEACDAFVLASDVETFGVVVIEALACGRPVVVTASGGPDHLVTAANGLLIPTANRPALREALTLMRRSAAGYDRASIRAGALRNYSPAAFARRFAEIVG